MLLVATRNPHKVRELRRLLPGVTLTSLAEVAPDAAAPIEDAADYRGNAIIKALAAYRLTGLPSLADDSGIECAALGWGPGILSARYVSGSDADRRRALHRAVLAADDRRARYVAAVVIAGLPEPEPLPPPLTCRGGCVVAIGVVEGRITDTERGLGGFGYDPIFEPLEAPGRTMASLSDAEKDAISHRGRAARLLYPLLGKTT